MGYCNVEKPGNINVHVPMWRVHLLVIMHHHHDHKECNMVDMFIIQSTNLTTKIYFSCYIKEISQGTEKERSICNKKHYSVHVFIRNYILNFSLPTLDYGFRIFVTIQIYASLREFRRGQI